MSYRPIFALLTVLLTAACAGKPVCMVEEPYQTASEFPPLKAPAGMQVPPPNPNLAIPEVREDGPVAYEEDEDAVNEYGVRCLETPPKMDSA
jgi:uncharacterized lipoprotein